MKILLLGGGGREQALAWKIAASPLPTKLWFAPRNAGIAKEAECVPVDLTDHAAVIALAKRLGADFVVVGPDNPLGAGIVDDLEAAGLRTFGPSKAAARLEGSKGFTKDLCRKFGIPTAAYERFSEAAIDMMFGGAFGASGSEVVIEEFLAGEEISFFALCDGETAVPLASAQDHKRAFDGDNGPNTGGMGAYSPVPAFTGALARQTMDDFVLPTMRAMKEMECPFKGILYLGLMLTGQG